MLKEKAVDSALRSEELRGVYIDKHNRDVCKNIGRKEPSEERKKRKKRDD
jgi:hypothetical protein